MFESCEGETNPDKNFNSSDIEILKECITKLPFKCKQVIILRYYEERSYEEIATITGLPLGTVKTYLFRGQKKLSKLFETFFKKKS